MLKALPHFCPHFFLQQNLQEMSRQRKRYTLASGLDPDSDDETQPFTQQISTTPAERLQSSKRTHKHISGFSSGIDPDSDDEMDLGITATSNASGRATVTYRVFPAEKKPRLESMSHAPAQVQLDPSNKVPDASDSIKRN